MGDLVALDYGPAHAPVPPRLLLVGANQRWTRAVSAAARRLGASVIDTASNSRVALSRILTAASPYSIVLLQARRADLGFPDLADLTTGDAGSGTGLLLLHDSRAHQGLRLAAHRPPGCIVIEQANRAAISRALNQPAGQPGAAPVLLSTAELRAALAEPMLKLRYQPLVRLSDRTPIGLEALARLDHPTFGMLAAEQFIPQMEAANLSHLLTEAIITQAMHDTYSHELTAHGLGIGLNVPLNVLMMKEVFDVLEDQRRKYAIPASKIIVELTETQPVTDYHALRDVIRRLRDIGYRVSIDDASPAIPNLESLMRLGFNTLKFDKSVVQQAAHDPESRSFIDRIVALARTSDMLTIAEGIEDAETHDLMRDLGVDIGQGFLIGRPLPPATIKLWLDAWQR